MLRLKSWKINLSAKQKSQSLYSKFQSTKDGFIVFGIWSLELGISMFFSSKRCEESPAKAFTEARAVSQAHSDTHTVRLHFVQYGKKLNRQLSSTS